MILLKYFVKNCPRCQSWPSHQSTSPCGGRSNPGGLLKSQDPLCMGPYVSNSVPSFPVPPLGSCPPDGSVPSACSKRLLRHRFGSRKGEVHEVVFRTSSSGHSFRLDLVGPPKGTVTPPRTGLLDSRQRLPAVVSLRVAKIVLVNVKL